MLCDCTCLRFLPRGRSDGRVALQEFWGAIFGTRTAGRDPGSRSSNISSCSSTCRTAKSPLPACDPAFVCGIETDTALVWTGRGSLVADVTARTLFFWVGVVFPRRPLILSCHDIAVEEAGTVLRGGAAAMEAKVGGGAGALTAFGGSLTTGLGGLGAGRFTFGCFTSP